MLNFLSKISALLRSGGKPSIKVYSKNNVIKFPKDYRDTSEARYAINEHGYLEEILNDKLSNQSR